LTRPPHSARRNLSKIVITFLSDYGPGDEYVGIVHGVIARIAPQARIIDLGHGVPPQDVRTGARRLARALPFTPPGIHLAVVDPGVGTTRRAVALKTKDRILVGPDNGLLVEGRHIDAAVEISNSPWRLEPVSATFHGRDIFAPVTAHLANGAPFEAAGEPIAVETLERLPVLAPRPGIVQVVEVDGFGNLITNGELPQGDVRIGGHAVTVGRTFGDVAPGGLVIYEDSAGDVAIAVNGGSAAARLDVTTGDELELQ
jgi:S-adenosyl-L-methionine hydrolase (adenosine-forming)